MQPRRRNCGSCESTTAAAVHWGVSILSTWSDGSVEFYTHEKQAVHRNHSNSHNRFVSRESPKRTPLTKRALPRNPIHSPEPSKTLFRIRGQ